MISLPENNTEWIRRAFFHVQATLLGEIVAHSGDYLSEDYIRSAMLRGLILTNPAEAGRVQAELPASWTGAAPWNGAPPPAHESPCRHDVGVGVNAATNDPGILCEVKWLKQAQVSAIVQDIWKLSFSRGVLAEGACPKTFLLIGGEHEFFASTLQSLQSNDLNFRWSKAGRGAYELPEPKFLNLERGLRRHATVRKAAAKVLKRGQAGLRQPPNCVSELRLSVRHVWHEKVAERSWTIVLWELDHRGVDPGTIDWQSHRAALEHVLQRERERRLQAAEPERTAENT